MQQLTDNFERKADKNRLY